MSDPSDQHAHTSPLVLSLDFVIALHGLVVCWGRASFTRCLATAAPRTTLLWVTRWLALVVCGSRSMLVHGAVGALLRGMLKRLV